MRRNYRFILGILLPLLAVAAPVNAAFHLMKVVEVFPGTPASPSAQYVVLQMYSGGQNLVGNHTVRVFDASNTQIAVFTFGGNVANGASQSRILIATGDAETFFGVTSNLAMTAVLPLAGGKVCFDSIDCVAYGNYSGSATGVGTPFNATGGGLRQGQAIKRRLDISGGATTLAAADDTGDSDNDWLFGLPAPRNNAGASGTIPAATCGNAAVEGLEICDDGNTTGGDGCRADCAGVETCGDGTTDPDAGEICDDGNTMDGDVCPSDCGVVAEAVPSEATDIRVSTSNGQDLDVLYQPACAATNHAVYAGFGPFDGGIFWIDALCSLGTTGSVTFDSGESFPDELLYFVIVGYDDDDGGSFGTDSALAERPGGVGVADCDRPVGDSTCD